MRGKLQVDDMTARRRFLETDAVVGAGAALHALGPGRAGADSPTSGRVPFQGRGPTPTSSEGKVKTDIETTMLDDVIGVQVMRSP